MTDSQTLQFENARVVQALFANDLKLVKNLEDAFQVKVTTRDGWVRLDGEKDHVQRARLVVEQLEGARRNGMDIQKHEFSYALNSVEKSAGSGLADLASTKIICSPRRNPVIPKTAGQQAYIRTIEGHDMTFGVGPAGTGKTYLGMAMAISALKSGAVNRLILTRPAVEAGEALGFLPGDLKEKIMPYLRPLYDALHDMLESEEVERLMERGIIEIAPLAYMRGRTLNNAFIVLDEAQNTTNEQMFMFLTRMGFNSKCVITGDRTQIVLPPNKRSGLIEALQALRGVKGVALHFFEDRDVVRHELVQSIVRAYQRYRGTESKS